MIRALLVAVALVVACGDNIAPPVGVALVDADNLTIVAHQDDDLLFMQADLFDALARGESATTVYVTAGDNGEGADYADHRQQGVMAAYASALGAPLEAWSCGWIELAAHAAYHCRLAGMNLSLVFLGYPDGGLTGDNAASLLHLWEGTIARATTVAHVETSYDRAELLAVLAEILADTAPKTIRTLEIAAVHGDDHSDHMLVGALTALVAAGADGELLAYRGYDMNDEQANLPDALFARGAAIYGAYAACATSCDGTCGKSACTQIPETYQGYLHRRYAVGTRRAPLHGELALDGACADGQLALGACGAAAWTFARAGVVQTGETCITAGANATIAPGACSAALPVMLDDEGHLWPAVPPAPQPNMIYDHLLCLAGDGAAIHADLCGAAREVRWNLVGASVTSSRAALGLAQTGRAVRLGDLTGDHLGDLCEVDSGRLTCAAGDGTGAFAAAAPIDSASAPLAIDPESLALGDLDGDGKLDACGFATAGGGVLCAFAATQFAAAPLTTALAGADPATLSISGGELCANTAAGVTCMHAGAPRTISAAMPGATTWIADLDGDGRADWCTSTATGPACAIAASSSAAGAPAATPWAFSRGGVIEGAADPLPAAPATTALADVTGDGRADLCTLVGDSVACAITASAYGFGPRAVFAALPAGTGADSLWLGDLDGDGRADPCVAAGDAILCARSP